MGDFGFDSDPFNSNGSTAASSRPGAGKSRNAGLTRNKSNKGDFDSGSVASGGGGGIAPPVARPSAGRSRRRASMAGSAPPIDSGSGHGNGGNGGGFGNFDQGASFDTGFQQPQYEAPAAPAAPRPRRSARRASVVGSSTASSRSLDSSGPPSRSLDSGSTEPLTRGNKPARSRSGASDASIGSTGSGATGIAGRPRRSRRASMAGSTPEMSHSTQPEPATDYGYGASNVETADYGYGGPEQETTDYGYSEPTPAPAPAPTRPTGRRESMGVGVGVRGSDPFADLKSGGGFSSSKPANPGIGSNRGVNIMLPMANAPAPPEKPKEAGGGRSRRRASMLGMVGTLAGVGGGASGDKMQSLDDGDSKKASGKKGFFKDRKSEKAGGANPAVAVATDGKRNADRRRGGEGGGGLLDRLDAAPSSRGAGRAQGNTSYSDRIMTGN